jgi:TonB family protein
MGCKKYTSLLIGRIYGTLTSKESDRLDEHLSTCAHCRTEFKQMEETLSLVQGNVPLPEPPGYLDTAVLTAARSRAKPDKSPFRFFLFKPIPAAAALAVLALVFTTLYTRHQGSIANQYQSATRSIESTPEPESDDTLVRYRPKKGSTDSLPEPAPILQITEKEKLERKSIAPAVPARDKSTLHRESPDAPSEKMNETGDTGMSLGAGSIQMDEDRLEEEFISDTDEGLAMSDMPQIIQRIDPELPDELRSLRIQGIVIIEMTITELATVTDISILKSLHPLCDAAAVEAVQSWQYRPASQNGKPIAKKMSVAIPFHPPQSPN